MKRPKKLKEKKNKEGIALSGIQMWTKYCIAATKKSPNQCEFNEPLSEESAGGLLQHPLCNSDYQSVR